MPRCNDQSSVVSKTWHASLQILESSQQRATPRLREGSLVSANEGQVGRKDRQIRSCFQQSSHHCRKKKGYSSESKKELPNWRFTVRRFTVSSVRFIAARRQRHRLPRSLGNSTRPMHRYICVRCANAGLADMLNLRTDDESSSSVKWRRVIGLLMVERCIMAGPKRL